MTMGQRLAARRKELGLSQEALADAVGVSRQAVSKWELDEAQPDAAKIVLLAQTLRMTTDALLLGEAETAPQDTPPAPEPDRLNRLERLVHKHGYKAGYLLIVWGLVLALFSGAGILMFHGFFAAADESLRDFNGVSIGWSVKGDFSFSPADGVPLTDEEITAIEQELIDKYGLVHPVQQLETHAFPPALQRAVYAVLALPALLGAALVVTGIVVVVKYKGKE